MSITDITWLPTWFFYAANARDTRDEINVSTNSRRYTLIRCATTFVVFNQTPPPQPIIYDAETSGQPSESVH